MAVTVTPEAFTFTNFDHAALVATVEKLAADLGMSALDIRVEVDETTPLGRTRVVSVEPIVLSAESGALEDPKRLRALSEPGVGDAIGRLLLRVRDRRDPAFGDPPPDGELSQPHTTAWATYCVGRLSRLGYRAQRQRRLYTFRNRHGFTDAADAAFDALWSAESLTWDEIVALSDDARSVLA